MDFIDREITKEELHYIYADFKEIEIQDGVPQVESKRHNIVVEDNGKVIGFASGLTNYTKWFFLSDLWVHKNYRRQGIGGKLLNMLEEKIKSIGIEHIYTWTTGFINPKFYERQGYDVFTVFENFCGVEGYNKTGYRKDLTSKKRGESIVSNKLKPLEILAIEDNLKCTCPDIECEWHGNCKDCVSLHRYHATIPNCLVHCVYSKEGDRYV